VLLWLIIATFTYCTRILVRSMHHHIHQSTGFPVWDISRGWELETKREISYVQLDRVMMILEVIPRSSGTQAPPTTLRAFFDSPG
jgi:hypothetical protein